MRPGYKQTGVGLIPEDWDVAKLGDIGECLIGLTYDPSNVRASGLLVLRASNIEDGVVRFDDNVFVDVEVPERIIVRKDDILICVRNGSRDLIGKCALMDERTEGMTFGAFMSVFRTKHARFMFQAFQSDLVKKQIHEHVGATINQITNKNFESFEIPFPRSEKEESAISEALSDADALMAVIDLALAKKRNMKTAAMQQLLTGGQRLPGFSGEWEVHRFDEIALPRRERIDPKGTRTQEFCIELEHIEQATGHLIGSTSTGEHSSLKSVFYAGDVLFGKLRAYLRKYWLADRQGVCSTEIWALMPNGPLISSEYLFQIVRTDRFIETASTAYGTHMPRSDWNVVRSYEIAIPSLREQGAIAAVLSDMDVEIMALQARRDKAQALKEGMMQQLLTGKIRLI
jgi:type I restriction enzyme, S subunit